MFLPFTIKKSVIDEFVRENTIVQPNYKNKKNDVKRMLESYLVGDRKTIDGSLLQSEWFPTDTFPYNVFISHSHNDFEEAKTLCTYLEQECGLSCFIDEFAWKSADELLRQIDNRYCKITEKGNITYKHYGRNVKTHYDYKKRNYTTSHIHAMLSMAILEIMDKCECIIFIDSDQSVRRNEFGKLDTLSPWLYEETRFMRKLKPRIPDRFKQIIITKAFTAESIEYVRDSMSIGVNFRYKIDDVKDLDSISLDKLTSMSNYKENASLDSLYKNSKYYKRLDGHKRTMICD